MSFLDDIGLGAAKPGTLTSLFDPGDLLGTDRARKAKKASEQAESAELTAQEQAIAEIQRATAEGQAFLEPFGGVGLQGVEQAGFLTDPQAQFKFLQGNPLFQSALENANQATLRGAAGRGRLSAGDTLERLTENTLLTAQPLIQEQKRSISDILNFGSGIARSQANTALGQGSDVSALIQGRGDILAGGIAGRNRIQAQTTANQNQLAAQIFSLFAGGAGGAAAGAGAAGAAGAAGGGGIGGIGGLFSDPRLKMNKKKIGFKNGFTLWSWDWNKLANKLGLFGSSSGVMADEVKVKRPEAISYDQGFMKVNRKMIGV